MALNGVCELSSLLRVDDIEKTELVRKKNSLELAIKQQEGRLIYEVEEHERLIGEANATMERYSDLASSVEFSELRASHLCDSSNTIRIRDVASSIDIYSSDHERAMTEIGGLEEVLTRIETAANETTDINAKDFTGQLQCVQNNLIKLTDEHDKVAQEALCIEQDIARGKDIVGNLDEQTADFTLQADSVQRLLGKTCDELRSSESARDEIGEVVHRLRDDIHKLEFHNSAELGKQGQTIAQTQEKVLAEEQTIVNIDSNIVELDELTSAARAGLEETTRRETDLTEALRSQEESLSTQKAEISEITVQASRISSEILSIRNVMAASSAQSFQGRAEALQQDIAGVERSAAAMREDISVTLAQIDCSSPNEQIQTLEVELREASSVRDGAQQQIVQDSQAAQSNAQEQERLLREMQSTSSALGQARSQTQQQQNVVEELRGTAATELVPLEVEGIQSAVDEKERLVAAEQQLAGKLSKGSQVAATQLSARNEDLNHLRKQIDEMERAAAMKHFAFQKQARISSARDGVLSQQRMEITALRKSLMEEDKRFQRRHLEATAMRDARKAELGRELQQLEAERASLQALLNPPALPSQCSPAEPFHGGDVGEITAGRSPTGVSQLAGTGAPNPAPEKRPGVAKKGDSHKQQGKAAKMRMARK